MFFVDYVFINNDSKLADLANLESEILDLIKNKDSKTYVVKLKIDKSVDLFKKENYERILKLTKRIKSLSFDSVVCVEANDSCLTKSEIETLVDFEDALGKNESILMIDGGLNQEYSLMELLLADEKIKSFVTNLKAKNLSPFENYLAIYDFLTQKVYNSADNQEMTTNYKSRDVISVMNGDNIVCVGYAQVMKRLCKEFGIRCEVQGSSVYDKNGEYLGGHENNSVYLVDKKYGIKGWYYADACWDSVKKGEEHRRNYNYCLIPLSDKNKMKKTRIDIDEFSITSRLYGGEVDKRFFSEEDKKLIKEKFDEKALNLVYDDKKREYAYKKLVDLLKKHNVPENIFQQCKGKKVPEECSINNMLAFMFLGKTKVVEDLINKLLSVVNSEDVQYSYFDDESVNDIYKKLEEKKSKMMKKNVHVDGDKEDCEKYINLKNQIEKDLIAYVNTQLSDVEKNKAFEKMKEMLKEQRQLKVRLVEKQEKIDKENVLLKFNECEKISEILQQESYRRITDMEIESSSAISLKTFKNALCEAYRAEGMQKNLIDYKVDDSLERTKRCSELIFSTDAQNCFSVAAKEQRQLGENNFNFQ